MAGVRWTSDRMMGGVPPDPDHRPRLLLLCDFRPHEAATVIDHIEAIRQWSRYDVLVMPMFGDLPGELDLAAFDGLVTRCREAVALGSTAGFVVLEPCLSSRVGAAETTAPDTGADSGAASDVCSSAATSWKAGFAAGVAVASLFRSLRAL